MSTYKASLLRKKEKKGKEELEEKLKQRKEEEKNTASPSGLRASKIKKT